jgi:hypothetical protein
LGAITLIAVLIVGFLSLIALFLGGLVWWRIYAKTGHGGPLGLLMLLPLVNVVMLFVLAFGEWPIQAELKRLRGTSQPPGAPGIQPPAVP